MAQLINYKQFTDYKTEQREKTKEYLMHLKEQGYEILTPQELKNLLLSIGYKIAKSMEHNYYNTGNEMHYLAKSIYIIDIKTKLSFAHYTQEYTNRENQEKLQKIRRNTIGYDGIRIWDI